MPTQPMAMRGVQAAGREKPQLERKSFSWAAPYLFLAPALLLFIVFVLLPMVIGIWLSLLEWDVLSPPRYVGLENYRELISTPRFRYSIWVTILYTFGSVPVGIILSLLCALALNQNIRFRTFFRSALVLPTVTSLVAVGLLWRFIFSSEYGVVNYVLTLLGASPVPWLAEAPWALISVVVVDIWRHLGYNMVIILAGLQAVPSDVFEAAKIDGASSWQRFRYVTVPLLRPTLLFVSVISVISSFRSFDHIYVMTGGGPGDDTTVWVVYLYQEAFQFFRMGLASAAAYVLFALLLLLTFVQMRLFDKETD
jgi:multiple sugar transport system permease protein